MDPSPTLRRLVALLLGAALATAAHGDDTSLFSSAALAPNVLLLVDSSGSMNGMMYHKAWDGGGHATCDVIPPTFTGFGDLLDDNGDATTTSVAPSGTFLLPRSDTAGFVATPGLLGSSKSGYVERTFCGQTRKLYIDGNNEDRGGSDIWSRWFDPYVDWYFGLDPTDTVTTYGPDNQTAAEILAEIDDDANGQDYITGATFPLYKRSRMTAAASVAKEVMYRINSKCPAYAGDCGIYQNNVRFGIAQFQVDSHGGFVTADIGEYPSNKAALEATLDSIDPNGSTPLGESLFTLYTYFMSRTAGERVQVTQGATTVEFPEYDYRLSNGAGDAPSSDAPQDPVDVECRKNFILILTDGEPGRDDFATSGSETDGFADFTFLIGDYAPDAAGDPDIGTDADPEYGPPWIDGAGAGFLDDIALFMQDHDLRPVEFPNTKQVVDVYTLGFGTTGNAVESLLQKTADNGNGIYRKGTQSDELVAGLIESLSHIIEKTQTFTSATVPATRTSSGNNLLTSYFRPSETNPFWEGHLKLFEFNSLGEIRDAPVPPATQGACAIEDPLLPNRCEKGRLKFELDGYWDAADMIPAAEGLNARSLFVSLYGTSRPSTIPSTPAAFDTTLTTADLDFPGLGISISDLSDFDVAGNSTGIPDVDGLKDAIVRYIRGCEFQAGSCVDRGAGRKLWDIFHSSPVMVGAPNAGHRKASYREFVNRYGHRPIVAYAGSNGGFVHGFKVAEYGTLDVPDGYDRGISDAGEELFGFMAWPARRSIAELPRTVGTKRYYMDATPAAGDVWLYPASQPAIHPDDVASDAWNRWRTVLVGGMRQGGRVIWALDVSNPEGITGGPAYPGYMWEFPCEANAAVCTGTSFLPGTRKLAEYMGETWSEPVLTKVKVTVNCSSNCESYDRWVAIFAAGYDPLGDPNLTHNTSTDPSTRATASVADDYDGSLDAGTSRAGRAVFMVDIASGEVLAMRRFDHDASNGDPDMEYAFVAAPAVFDLDFDGYADVAYFADLGGNVWKWVIRDVVADPVNGLGDVEQAWDGYTGWKWLKVMTAESCTGSNGATSAAGCSGGSGQPPPHFRSFFFPPQGALVGARLWLAIGSGERNDLAFRGTLDAQKNRLYVFHDDDPLEFELSLPSAGSPRYTDDADQSPADFVNASTLTGSCTPPTAPAVGFYLEGEHGEKFVTETEIFFGNVITGSYVPPSSASPCDTAGTAYLYGFNLYCGAGALPPPGGSPSDPKVARIQVERGLPSRPRVSVGDPTPGGGGCENRVVVITSEGQAFSDCPDGSPPESGLGVRAWRDL